MGIFQFVNEMSKMSRLDDLFKRAEELAYEEADVQGGRLNDDRILAIAKQLIHNEIQDPAVAKAAIDAVSDRIYRSRKI